MEPLKWIGIFTVLSVAIQLSNAARRVNLEHHISKRSVHFRRSNPSQLLGLQEGEHLVPSNKFRTAKGTTKIKMQETYKGIPVVGESVVLEMDDEGRFTGEVSGKLLEGINEDIPSTKPGITSDQALGKALAYTGDKRETIMFNPYKDVQLEVQVRGEDNVVPKLVYRLNYRIERPGQLSRPSFLIDANTGHILKSWDALTMANWRHRSRRRANPLAEYELVDGVGGNDKVGKYIYGLDLPSLKVSVSPNGSCVLENQYALVYNCNESYTCPVDTMEPYHFDCIAGNNDTVNGAYSPLNDAMFHVGLTYEMYSEWYEISDILQNRHQNGGRCPTRVHFGQAYENAFWDGEQITFGDGASMLYPLTSLNVVTHEISHGFTEKNSDLIYIGESGGMNEAFSDMAGEAAEDFLKHKIDWMVGFAIWKKKNESMRYFDDPPKDGHSIQHFDDFCFAMNVHSSSGIYNRAFYILSNLPGWCVRKAFHIFVIANSMYWQPNSDFHSGACDVQRAANDLGYNVDDVTFAFRQVGIEPCSKKQSNEMGSALSLKNMSSISYNLTTKHDEELAYSELIVYLMQSEPLSLTVETESHIYTVTPKAEYGETVKLNLGRECYSSECTLTVTSKIEALAILMPIAQVIDIVSGLIVESHEVDTNQSGNGTTTLGNETTTTPSPNDGAYVVSFEIPEAILKLKLRVVFRGTANPESMGNMFIRHEEPPNLESNEYDAVGTLNREPVLLCKPRNGTYYLAVAPHDETIRDVRVTLGVWLKGDIIREEEKSKTPTQSATE